MRFAQRRATGPSGLKHTRTTSSLGRTLGSDACVTAPPADSLRGEGSSVDPVRCRAGLAAGVAWPLVVAA